MIWSAVFNEHLFFKHCFSKRGLPKHWKPVRYGRCVGVLVLAMVALSLGACGQRGDLVLPQDPTPADETQAATN